MCIIILAHIIQIMLVIQKIFNLLCEQKTLDANIYIDVYSSVITDGDSTQIPISIQNQSASASALAITIS
jgi:hypothetical protein